MENRIRRKRNKDTGGKRNVSHSIHSLRSSPDCADQEERFSLLFDESFLQLLKFSLSPIITSGLGFKGEGVHLQVNSTPNGIRCDTEGAAREHVRLQRKGETLCSLKFFYQEALNSYPEKE